MDTKILSNIIDIFTRRKECETIRDIYYCKLKDGKEIYFYPKENKFTIIFEGNSITYDLNKLKEVKWKNPYDVELYFENEKIELDLK